MTQLSQTTLNPPENLSDALEVVAEECLESLWGLYWADSFDESAVKAAVKWALHPHLSNAVPVSVPRSDLEE